MRTVEEIRSDAKRFNTLCRNVFSTHDGGELMNHMKRLFVDVRLYDDDERKMVYNVAQHDFVRELESHIVTEEPVNIED